MLKYIVLFILVICTIAAIIGLGSLNLEDDPNFQKLNSSKGSSLIIGTSRAGRLKGDLINQAIGIEPLESDSFLNYAFNLGVSPYGIAYKESIIRLCENVPREGESRFILSIDPWALSTYKTDENITDQGSYLDFKPKGLFPKIRYTLLYNTKPNLERLFISSINERKSSRNVSKRDTSLISLNTKTKIYYYQENHLTKMRVSNKRLKALTDLIIQLKKKGKVYLLRIPVSPEMAELEREYAPYFMENLLENSIIQNTPILDFYPYQSAYDCFDGNHLFEEDAENLSTEIGRVIRWYEASIHAPSEDIVHHFYEEPESK